LAGVANLAQKIGADGGKDDSDSEAQEYAPRLMATVQEAAPERAEVREGWLVPAPKGGHHYVGPASLVYFAQCARHLVGKSNLLKQPTYDERGLRRYLQAAEYTNYKVSHTLEANIEGHPATVAAGSEASPSTTLEERGGPSPRDAGSWLDRGMADALVNAFFERVHYNFPILHRGAFQMQYERSFGQASLVRDPGWTCTLYMIYTLGAQALAETIPGAQDLEALYLSLVVREGLGRIVLSSTLRNVQAVLLLALYQHNAGERNTAWILIGQATRSAIALGLHHDGENSNFDPFERNIRRIVWWTLHLFEQYISLALGRPSFSDVISVTASLPDASFELGIGLPANYLEFSVSLSRFVVRIKQAIASISVLYQDSNKLVDLYPTIMAIHSDLIVWKKSLPSSLGLDQRFVLPSHRRLVFILLVWADYLESVLCRPYLLCRVNRDLDGGRRPEEIDEVASLAVSAAQASATKLLVLADHGLLEGSVWLDCYAVQHAISITALHLLGQPSCEDADGLREPIARLIDVASCIRLAPTYRITMTVALQLASITGIGPESPSNPNDPPSFSPGNAPIISPRPIEPLLNQVTAAEPGHTSELDIFADLYNLGYDGDAYASWFPFDLGTSEVGLPPDGQ
jgi:proline utilization trans-activator